jgi:hypothetical protein
MIDNSFCSETFSAALKLFRAALKMRAIERMIAEEALDAA